MLDLTEADLRPFRVGTDSTASTIDLPIAPELPLPLEAPKPPEPPKPEDAANPLLPKKPGGTRN